MNMDDPNLPASAHLMRSTLQLAVPLWAMRLRPVPFDRLVERAPTLAQVVAEKGDVAQFRGSKKGETAAAFNAIAEGLAILSFLPGGVRFMGDHYQNEHPDNAGAPPTPPREPKPEPPHRTLAALLADLPFDRSEGKDANVATAHRELVEALAGSDLDRVEDAAMAYDEAYRAWLLRGGLR